MQRLGPTNRREARLWNIFNTQDLFWPIKDWPPWVIKIALLEHKNNRERFQLFFFFNSNGLSPELAASWILAFDYRQGMIIEGVYDKTAKHQVQIQLPTQAENGMLYKGQKAAIDMTTGHVVYM